MSNPTLTVVGSANLDLVARSARLPRAGETLTDATFARHPGGKGANQAVAAARLGAKVRFVGAVGDDAFAEPALAGLREAEVELELSRGGATGVALILVDEAGENVIVVAPGANAELGAVETGGNVLCQLEIPVETVASAARSADRFFLNAAPAKALPPEVIRAAEIVVVNRYELEALSETPHLTALTLGEEGAALLEDGTELDRPLVRELRVAANVHGETGLDGPDLPQPRAQPEGEHAVDFLAGRIAGRTLVATGPLTNVALLLARHPEARPERLVLMGGAIAEGNVTPAAEFNIWADPEAAARVFESGLDVTMVGLDVTHKALMTREHAEELRKAGRAGQVVGELFDFFSVFHRDVYGFEGAPIHDAVAVAQVLRPELLRLKHVHVAVDTESTLCRGRTVVDVWRRTGNEPNADVAVDIDAEAFLSLLVERLSRLS